MEEVIAEIAMSTAEGLGTKVNNDQINPALVMIGTARGLIAFWTGCAEEGSRTDALQMMQTVLNEEIDNLKRGIANGMVPA